MTSTLSTGIITKSVLADGERRDEVLHFEASESGLDHYSVLTEIMHLVDMRFGVSHEGWTRESARLFAIDTAMTVVRRNLISLPEVDRQTIAARLQEARTLVVGDRDDELGFIQAALETQLGLTPVGQERRVWLTAIDALIPNPFRAALISTRNALAIGTSEAFADLGNLLRERLIARLDEGILNSGPPNTLFLTA
jgi:hypothetical protein